MNNGLQHVFVIGAKNIGFYGGYETFVKKLIEYHKDQENLKYHIASKANGMGSMDEGMLDSISDVRKNRKGEVVEFEYQNAHCVKIRSLNVGAAQAILYDLAAIKWFCSYVEKNKIAHPVFYILACRIGPFMKLFARKIHKLGGKVYINPDGHEWMRAKWGPFVRKYWKYSEKWMVRHSDLVICDSKCIEEYIHENYDGKCVGGNNPETVYLSYGAEVVTETTDENEMKLRAWLEEHRLERKRFYLIVGRFIPENNYETVIREFMMSHSKKTLAIIANTNEEFLVELESKLHYQKDERIQFVGTVYDQELLRDIRRNAYAYFHGHEVGGTNPSLLEALGATDLNLLLDVGFNQEVAEDAALYWTKERGNLAKLIDDSDEMDAVDIRNYGIYAKQRIRDNYSWSSILSSYEELFINGNKRAAQYADKD